MLFSVFEFRFLMCIWLSASVSKGGSFLACMSVLFRFVRSILMLEVCSVVSPSCSDTSGSKIAVSPFACQRICFRRRYCLGVSVCCKSVFICLSKGAADLALTSGDESRSFQRGSSTLVSAMSTANRCWVVSFK